MLFYLISLKYNMPQLPQNRQLKKIEQCLDKTIFSVWKIKKQDYKLEWKYAVIDQGQELIAWYSNDETKAYTWKLPIIIYWDHTNIVKYVDFPFICWADWTKVFQFKNDVDVKFMEYLLNRFKPETQGYRRHYSLLKEIQIPLPPLSKQKEIVAHLDQLSTHTKQLKQKYQSQLDHIEELRKSVLDQAFNPNRQSSE